MSSEEKNPIDMYFDMKEGRVKLAQKEDSGAVSLLNGYLATTRMMVLVFQHSHWKCKGSHFYGNHLMFERVYKDARKLVDLIAEKLIGIYGNDALMHDKQVAMMSELFNQFNGEEHFDNAIGAAELFLQLSEDTYNRLKEMDSLTLGMDDMIMSNASKVEEFLYLMRQAKSE